jgi:hypothetical protein
MLSFPIFWHNVLEPIAIFLDSLLKIEATLILNPEPLPI